MHTLPHIWRERDVYVHVCTDVHTHTAQSTPVFVEIQVVQSVLKLGLKETERQVDLQGEPT